MATYDIKYKKESLSVRSGIVRKQSLLSMDTEQQQNAALAVQKLILIVNDDKVHLSRCIVFISYSGFSNKM